jgi:hypothetical protein
MIKFHLGQTVYSRKIVSGPLKLIALDTLEKFSFDYYVCEASDGIRYSIPKLYLSSKPIVETE